MPKLIAIVDAYSAAAAYARVAKELGLDVIHIQSTEVIPPAYQASFHPQNFLQNFIYNKTDSAKLMRELKQLNVTAVLTGIETGVKTADELSEKLHLRSNKTPLSDARRDKYKMHQALKKMGVRIPLQILSHDAHEIDSWMKRHDFKKIVLKPVNSAGSDDVRIVVSLNEIKQALTQTLGKKNQLGFLNSEVIAQEYIDGTEYAVNAVSFGGVPHFTHIWKYFKQETPDGDFIYDYELLLNGNGPEEESIYHYVRDVLEALGIEYGPTHTEIKIDHKGAVLIEMAARVDGISDPHFDSEIVPQGQIELSLRSWTDSFTPQNEKKYIPYKRKKCAANVSLISHLEGRVSDITGLESLRRLPSYFAHRWRVKNGDFVSKTKNIFTSPGVIFLAHEKEEQVLEDLKKIRALEDKNDIFKIIS